MKKLTIEDIRTALYEINIPAVRSVPLEELPTADFFHTLQMNEREVFMLMYNLEYEHRIKLPPEVLESVQMKNTVGTLLQAANHHLIDLSEN